MRYSELKTIFMSLMESSEIPATIFDFAESFDSAVDFIVLNMPADVVHDRMSVYTTDVSTDTNRQVPLPSNYLKFESVRLAKTREVISEGPPIVYGNPIFLPATVLPHRAFLTKVEYSDEPVVSFFNSMLNFNPDLPEALDDYIGPIELSYRRIPDGYIIRYNNYSKGALFTSLDQSSLNSNIFTTETLGQTFADLGLSTESLQGGRVCLILNGNVYYGDIDYTWDDDGGLFSGLHIKESTIIGSVSSGIIGNTYLSERRSIYTGGSSNFQNDNNEPDLPLPLHRLAIDFAIAKFLMTRKPEIGSAYMQLAIQEFGTYGVNFKIDFGGEEQ